MESSPSKTPCPWCGANSTNVPWSDPRPSALWRATCYNKIPHEDWMEAHLGVCDLFKVAGITNSTVKADLMHTKHLGVDACMLGSILSFFCNHKFQCSETQNMTLMWRHTQRTYKDLGDGGWPGKFLQGEDPNITHIVVSQHEWCHANYALPILQVFLLLERFQIFAAW